MTDEQLQRMIDEQLRYFKKARTHLDRWADTLFEVAREDIERNLGNVAYESKKEIYEEAFALAFDALVKCQPFERAREIADDVARLYSQP